MPPTSTSVESHFGHFCLLGPQTERPSGKGLLVCVSEVPYPSSLLPNFTLFHTVPYIQNLSFYYLQIPLSHRYHPSKPHFPPFSVSTSNLHSLLLLKPLSMSVVLSWHATELFPNLNDCEFKQSCLYPFEM